MISAQGIGDVLLIQRADVTEEGGFPPAKGRCKKLVCMTPDIKEALKRAGLVITYCNQ